MIDLPPLPLEPLVASALVFSRTAGLLLTLPGFGPAPATVRLGLALPLTIILYPSISDYPIPATLPMMIGGVLLESITGIAMGMLVSILISTLTVMGEMISVNIGLHLAQMLDPLTNSRSDAMGSLFSILAMALFIGSDTHLECIKIFAESFRTIPPGVFLLPSGYVPQLVDAVGIMLRVGISLAGPITVFVFLIHLGLSILGRMAPNLNIFFSIGMSLTLVMGLLIILASIGPTLTAFLPVLDETIAQLARMARVSR